MRIPSHSPFFKWVKSIPVERAEDISKQGTGKIQFINEINIVGEYTRFLD